MRVLLVALLWTAVSYASAQAEAPMNADQPSITATAMSRAVIAGIHVGLEDGEKKGKVAPAVAACVRAIDENALAPLYEKLMRERMGLEDIRTLDAFYGSEAGKRYYRWTMNELRAQHGLPILHDIDFSKDEQDRANAFHGSGPGKILADLESKEIGEAIERLLNPCR